MDTTARRHSDHAETSADARSRKHCIVTPDFIGPIKNGGIGTACYHLARFLSKDKGYDVSVLFTGPVETGTPDRWRRHYAESDSISFYTLENLPELENVPHHNLFWFHARSFRIDRWLRQQRFDAIHFQDWQANGFVPAQAKRQGLAYGYTLLTCTVHSPQQWINEGSRRFPSAGVEDMLQSHNERYAACQADLTVFPSRHMLDWAKGHSWEMRRAEIAPNLWTGDSSPRASGGRQPVTEFCFFGRLETRKGLEVFTAALARLRNQLGDCPLPLISCHGKQGQTTDGPAAAHLSAAAAKLGVGFNLLDDLDSSTALDYMASREGCVAIMPSLRDNLPYAVIECLQRKIPLLASATGGIPELVSSPEHIFDPEPASLAEALARCMSGGIAPARSTYSPEAAAERWRCLVQESPPPAVINRRVEPQDVTVCIAHYNHGEFLPEALDSLARQTVSGFHVVAVDDGSTDPHSATVFDEMQQRWTPKTTWRFIRKANSGVGSARNTAVQHSTTPYVVFLDADNIADPRMIEVMVAAMNSSGADCLTCYMAGFSKDPEGRQRLRYRYLPTGGCVEAGAVVNIFGDANCIVDKQVFFGVGGFSLNGSASFEDWELFARICLSGKTLDVVPEFLHFYRHLDSGFSRSTSAYLNHRRVMDAYAAFAPAWVQPILASLISESITAPSDNLPDPSVLSQQKQLRQDIDAVTNSTSWRLTAGLRWLGDLRVAIRVNRGTSDAHPRSVEEMTRHLRDLRSSTCWRITAPLRAAGDCVRRLHLTSGK